MSLDATINPWQCLEGVFSGDFLTGEKERKEPCDAGKKGDLASLHHTLSLCFSGVFSYRFPGRIRNKARDDSHTSKTDS